MAATGSGLQLQVAPIQGAVDMRSQFPLRLQFVNGGTERVRLLDCFQPLPVFFSFHLAKSDGTPVDMPGMGKIDFGLTPLKYVELRAGESCHVDVDISNLVRESLSPGTYILSVVYHNQYGAQCFQGKLTSNTISLRLEGSSGA